MVMNSYAGIDTSGASAAAFHQSNNPMLNQHAAPNYNSFNLDAFGGLANNSSNNQTGQNGGAGFWGDSSSTWYMPFNIDPPTIGDDNNLFNNNGFEWANFGGFGDMSSGMAPTGLTPRPDDMEGGHGDLGGEGGSGGLDGMS